LILGLVLTLAIAAISIFSAFGRFLCLASILLRSRLIRAGIHLVFGLICSIPFLAVAIVLNVLDSKIKELPSWIQVSQGEVSRLCLGGLFCTIVMVGLSTIIPAIF
jgi:hypothetical protein